MGIGLSTDDLLIAFMDSLSKRQKELTIEVITADAGLNPVMQSALNEAKTRWPNINIEEASTIFCIGLAFMDIIVRNNEALAKVIPHIES